MSPPATRLQLTPYADRSGDSGVAAYAIESDAIIVLFQGGAAYRYGPRHPGAAQVEEMKRLAQSGRGLSTYISRHVRDDYESQLR